MLLMKLKMKAEGSDAVPLVGELTVTALIKDTPNNLGTHFKVPNNMAGCNILCLEVPLYVDKLAVTPSPSASHVQSQGFHFPLNLPNQDLQRNLSIQDTYSGTFVFLLDLPK